MSDDENTTEEPTEGAGEASEESGVDADSLANEVADGVEEAGGDDEGLADEWAAAMEEAGETDDDDDGVKPAPMEEFDADEAHQNFDKTTPELDVILDISVVISMEVGNTQIPIRNLLQLNQGSVIELDRLAGEPLDVLVNGTLIAHGEVVMVNDKFGIRLTDVISQSERIQRLR
ncbi:flagellar motor switch protein FliN [Bermanella sp. WJH001]|uniref:flagellar motor switch protein FliN n=1 Tax=Bermanella sp. WJH001 TaxID=3048005 RepID=UPI0024BDD7AB|nr:flagellar motor switch protein FliN [Bermanella sp. WJH001]MDJ1539829.1 flagellar motor switch protein FliN [Bermanella sp. WJH001]